MSRTVLDKGFQNKIKRLDEVIVEPLQFRKSKIQIRDLTIRKVQTNLQKRRLQKYLISL